MRRVTTTLLTLLVALQLMAVPAKPGTVLMTQPDGTQVTIVLHGDEWLHYETTGDGYSVVRNEQGFYVYADLQQGKLVPTTMVAHDAAQRTAQERSFLTATAKYLKPEMTAQARTMRNRAQEAQTKALAKRRQAKKVGKLTDTGTEPNYKSLVILIQFNDKTFSRSDFGTVMTGMINEVGYTGYQDGNTFVNCTGSVRDYFTDNSGARFRPQFDVYGPYTVPFSQYYPNATDNCWRILQSAINQADADVDFSQYDNDGDGYVDNVYFIVAGYGANYGNDSRLWWPHRSVLYGISMKDGVRFGNYASSVELFGVANYPSSVHIDGIGTFCHEFSHVLGLPDFYDTDYDGTGVESMHPAEWSVMAGGSYQNEGRTPVGYSLYERTALGYASPVVISSEGTRTLEQIGASNTGYRINTPVSNEYFLFENRQKDQFKWDAYLPGSGMLVFRVEANNYVWNNNLVNANADHMYYELVRAGGKNHGMASNYDPFPGRNNVTQLHNESSPANLKTYAGKSTEWGLVNIKQTNGVISFDVKQAALSSISIDATMTLGIGLTKQLVAVADPDFAHYTLTWTSSNPAVATVDKDGNVTGVAEGTCTVTVTSDNGRTASCQVTVREETALSVSDFKQQTENEEYLLELNNAEVLYVYDGKAYVRDAAGSIVITNTGLDLKKDNRLTGTMYATLVYSDNMAQAQGTGSSSSLAVTAGEPVQPHEVALSDLTEDDYADYVLVKAVQFEKNSGYWATDGTNSARLWNLFQIKGISVPSVLTGKLFDVKAIYGTGVLNGQVVNQLNMLESPVEADLSGIGSVNVATMDDASAPSYNVVGQRVTSSYKGVVIRNGKKYFVK